MILRYHHLRHHPAVFRAMTGMAAVEFDALAAEVLSALAAGEQARRSRPARRRAIGGGRKHGLPPRDRLLLAVVWLRRYPANQVLGYLFGVSEPTARRAVGRLVPLLEAAGRDTMRLPDPGKGHRRDLDALLADTPGLAVLVDTFEQRVQRPANREEADAYYSGKKRQHTLKAQVAVDEATGAVVDVADSVRGQTHDLTLLRDSGLLGRLPEGVGALGDLGYVGLQAAHPAGLGATPRRKPRGQPRPPEDVAYNRAFARRRVKAEHTPSGGCAATRHWPTPIATGGAGTPRECARRPGWSTGSCGDIAPDLRAGDWGRSRRLRYCDEALLVTHCSRTPWHSIRAVHGKTP